MIAVFLTFLSLLISGSCSSEINIEQNGNEIKAVQSNTVPLNLINLNSDILYMILYKLELSELLKAAESIPELSDLIYEVFRRKYSKNTRSVQVRVYNHTDSSHIGNSVKFIDNTIII